MTCDLVLADLFWPSAAGREPYRGLASGALQQLLARASRKPLPGASLERWLAGAFGAACGRELPVGALALRGEGVDPGPDCWMHADPVHLELRAAGLVLHEPARLQITAQEARELTAALNAHFAAEGIRFVAPSAERWYARVPEPPRVATVPTAEVAGCDIARFLPQGADGARWHALATEMQMLLHSHPCNEARRARGAPELNGVWLWGAGHETALSAPAAYTVLWSEHPLARGLARASGAAVHALPESGAALLREAARAGQARALVVLPRPPGAAYGEATTWREALERLEHEWFSALEEAVRAAQIEELTLYGLGADFGVCARYTRAASRRFWRRRRPLWAYGG